MPSRTRSSRARRRWRQRREACARSLRPCLAAQSIMSRVPILPFRSGILVWPCPFIHRLLPADNDKAGADIQRSTKVSFTRTARRACSTPTPAPGPPQAEAARRRILDNTMAVPGLCSLSLVGRAKDYKAWWPARTRAGGWAHRPVPAKHRGCVPKSRMILIAARGSGCCGARTILCSSHVRLPACLSNHIQVSHLVPRLTHLHQERSRKDCHGSYRLDWHKNATATAAATATATTAVTAATVATASNHPSDSDVSAVWTVATTSGGS